MRDITTFSSKNYHERLRGRNLRHELTRRTTGEAYKLEMRPDSSSAHAISQSLGPGRGVKHIEVQTMWVQKAGAQSNIGQYQGPI